jgi:hypothetical protein
MSSIYSRMIKTKEKHGPAWVAYEGMFRAHAGSLGNGNPCGPLVCTVSTRAKMGQTKRTSTAIMTLSRHVEKVVR